MNTKPRILVLTGSYLPGWKAGGPIRSLSNLVTELGAEFDFRIITRDRDHTDTGPYSTVPLDAWVEVGKAKVLYARPESLSLRRLEKIVDSVGHQLVFLTGPFSSLSLRYMLLRRFRRVPPLPTLIASQGQLDPGALTIRRGKKAAFIGLAAVTGFFKGVDWQASTAIEAVHISSAFHHVNPYVASDIPDPPARLPNTAQAKEQGSVKLVFISRISHKKKLPWLLAILADLKGAVMLEIYGPKEADEWTAVEHEVASLPDSVQVAYRGILKPEDIDRALAQAHFFVLATLGENFGHAIYEALRIGRPVVISDRTPWRRLQSENAGWDLSLDDRRLWVDTLQACVDMGDESYRTLAQGAHAYAARWFRESNPAAKQVAVFNTLLGR